jgi:Tol biopolymer transport system component
MQSFLSFVTGDYQIEAAAGRHMKHLAVVLLLAASNILAASIDVVTKHPDWSPDGRSIAFEAIIDGESNVFIADIASGETTQLTHTSKMDSYPRFAPDGESLLFLSRRHDRFTVHHVSTRDLTVNDYPADMEILEPAFSPNGRDIAFRALLPESAEIMLARIDGGGLHRLSNNDVEDGFPSFSSDGKALFFHRKVGSFNQIFRVNLQSRVETQLTAGDFNSAHAHHSPDGTDIVFDADEDGDRNIFRMNLDTMEVEQLTWTPGRDGYPKWSPDGDRVAFHSERDGVASVYTMAADGSDQQRQCYQIN